MDEAEAARLIERLEASVAAEKARRVARRVALLEDAYAYDPILDDMLAQDGWTIGTAPAGYVEALKGTLQYQWRTAGLEMSQLWQHVNESCRKNAPAADGEGD